MRTLCRGMQEAVAAIESHWFQGFILLVILINSIFLAMDYYGQSDEWETMLKNANYAFVAIFVFELAVKLYGYGYKGYFADLPNRFDFVVVFCSVVEIVIVDIVGFGDAASLSVFRALRLMRVLQLGHLVPISPICLRKLFPHMRANSTTFCLCGLWDGDAFA